MQIKPVTEITSEVVSGVQRLARQLSPDSAPPTATMLEAIVTNTGSFLLLAEDETTAMIMGMVTVVVYTTPLKRMAALESVIVDEAARGRGAGSKLVTAAIELAKEQGASEVNLTSNPSREAANHLYQRLGFKRRETNVYCYRFDS